MAVETTSILSGEAWVSISNMSIVGHNKRILSRVEAVSSDRGSLVGWHHFWEALLFEVIIIVLLSYLLLNAISNLLAD